MVQWCNGAMVQWCNGAVVQWCNPLNFNKPPLGFCPRTSVPLATGGIEGKRQKIKR